MDYTSDEKEEDDMDDGKQLKEEGETQYDEERTIEGDEDEMDKTRKVASGCLGSSMIGIWRVRELTRAHRANAAHK